jgi:HEAT repeat protein
MEKTIQEFKNPKNPDRWKSIIALGEFGEPALDYLHHALSDDDKWVRYFAADMLGNIKHHDSVEHLVAKLLDEDQDVRWVAASALGRIGDARAAHALQQAYGSDNAFVKVFIEEALDQLATDQHYTTAMAHSQG